MVGKKLFSVIRSKYEIRLNSLGVFQGSGTSIKFEIIRKFSKIEMLWFEGKKTRN